MPSTYGIDPSLTSTGLAYIDGDDIHVGLARSAGHRGDSIAQRSQRIVGLADQVASWWPVILGPNAATADLIVIEGPTPGTRGGSVWDRAGLWWRIVDALPVKKVAVVPPATRAKWATGKGNADKAAIAAVAARLCPHVDLRSSDMADALVLALMGLHALGARPDLDTKYRGEALLKCQWPDDVTAALLEPYETLVEDE